ncbi:ATP-dependent DNA ligase [Anatilimnocola floriformis]|uniref:ATP-dependent DNA ligase n=1 Tax=Anatilimnocola floriformis TaxID=2948575 RepID=UPI0020C46B0B|nr:hypothetical protein [Anatilimnocola floriformis]
MLLDKSRVEIKLGDYGVAPATALSDSGLLPKVQEYRRLASSRMVPLEPEEIEKRIPKAGYFVSRKVDGEFTVLIYRDGQCVTCNPGGTVRKGLPWQDEAAKALAKAGIKSALIAGELYVSVDGRRPRVHDVTTVARQPQGAADLKRLRFAVFDILAIDDVPVQRPYAETWNQIEKVFGKGTSVHPVETKQAADAGEIRKLFADWVEDSGDEGLVVRSDTAGIFKIKPRHNLDAVVVGFTESVDDRRGMLHDLLLAVKRHDNTLQILTRVGGGFSDDVRREMLSDLKDMVVHSDYAEVNSDHVAYQMVRPDWVVEISCLDLISETTRGGPVNRMVLNFSGVNGHSKYEPVRRLPLAAVISPQFIRQREDKSNHRQDVRIEQVSERVEVTLLERDARQMTLPKSQMLRRDVYKKVAKGETMIRKFVTWQTNKENDSEEFPAYVLHFTDFSPNRKDLLEREVRVSSSLDQINALFAEMVAENIKKGWGLHSSQKFDVEPRPAAVEVAVAVAEVKTPELELVAVAVEAVVAAEEPAPTKSRKKAAPKLASSEPTKKTRKKSG